MENIDFRKCVIGIELGSTRIKAVLTDANGIVLSSGDCEWENRFENGIWTYHLEDIDNGLKKCYASLKNNVKAKYGITLTNVGYMGISGMMHGYMVFDEHFHMLTEFRTWRNNNAEDAANKLTDLFNFHIPARWSIAHLYNAIISEEAHVKDIKFQTTLAGYVHYLLTGEKVLSIGEASGIFPIDTESKQYDKKLMGIFNDVISAYNLPWKLEDILPSILVAGQNGGYLTKEGALWLDPDGDLAPGIPLCPPEGDAGTGMVATSSIRVRTGNVSAGTSIFGMIVLEKPLSKLYPEIDIVTTPVGDGVAMVHCNNCTSDINAWTNVFDEVASGLGTKYSKGELYSFLFNKSLDGDADCGGLLSYNYVSNENITKVKEGRPLFTRGTEDKFNLANMMKAHIYSSLATLKIGLDLLFEEGVNVESIVGHGGLFKSTGVADLYLASALNATVKTMENAGEGGPWGMALLASYSMDNKGLSLADWLDLLFKDQKTTIAVPDKFIHAGFETFIESYKKGLGVVRKAVDVFSKELKTKDERINQLKKRVLKANLDLVKNGLVIYTWGNVSEIDRELGLVAIKPSGVDYDNMSADDIVVLNLDGEIIEGTLKPSSDTPTHLELYKAHPEIGGVVHTHSTYATAFAQSGRSIPAYGTTHADYFYGEIPCTRKLTKDEIEYDYEKNTGKVINEKLQGTDVMAIPAILVTNHGPFAWGKNGDNAVYNATVLEEVAKISLLTERINNSVVKADQYLLDKHYNRKHGKNAYYGQGEKK